MFRMVRSRPLISEKSLGERQNANGHLSALPDRIFAPEGSIVRSRGSYFHQAAPATAVRIAEPRKNLLFTSGAKTEQKYLTGAPERIRTSDPQIRSLLWRHIQVIESKCFF